MWSVRIVLLCIDFTSRSYRRRQLQQLLKKTDRANVRELINVMTFRQYIFFKMIQKEIYYSDLTYIYTVGILNSFRND
jgi:hypothetical protein